MFTGYFSRNANRNAIPVFSRKLSKHWASEPEQKPEAMSVTIRKREWTAKGGTRVSYFLDYVDHNNERQRDRVEAPPVFKHDADAVNRLRAIAISRAKVIQQALQKVQRDADPAPLHACRISMHDLVAEYLDPTMYREKKEDVAAQMLKKLRAFPPSGKAFQDWTKQDSKDFLRFMADRDRISNGYLTLLWRTFKRAVQYGCDAYRIHYDPTHRVECKGGYKSRAKEQSLRPDELQKLLATDYPDEYVQRITLWMLQTGFHYKDFQQAFRSQLQPVEGGGYVLHWSRKKTSEQSWSFIPPELLAMAPGTEDALWPSMRFKRDMMNKHLRKWARQAGLTRKNEPMKLSVLWLRRTFANMARQAADGDPHVVQALMGHKCFDTQKHYVRMNRLEVVTASAKLSEMIEEYRS